MIDWVNAIMPFKHDRLICGSESWYISKEPQSEFSEQVVSPDGEIFYRHATCRKKAIARGSFDNGIAIQSSTEHEPGTHIWVSGSPKALQGHNLFGTNDPRILAAALAETALKTFGIETSEFERASWLQGRGVKFSIIDITEMLDLGNQTNATAWIRAASDQGRCKYRGRGKEDYGTVYYGKNSRRWALKLYSKFIEINSKSKKHALPQEIEQREALMNYADGTVRSELRLHSMELKKQDLQSGESWSNVSAATVWSLYMNKLELSGNIPLRNDIVERLPSYLRSTYALWQSGADVRALLPRTTLFRHRSAFRKFGIDISTTVNRSNVVPLIRVIEARPKSIPSWAYGTPLLLAA